MKKIILTGSRGNLGAALTNQLNNSDILGIHRGNWDALKMINNNEYETIIHAASDIINDPFSTPTKSIESNILTTSKLLEIASEKKIKNFIFISSCSVYGALANCNENSPTNPITLNGFQKLFNEELIKGFCLKNNINYIILRLFNTYGGNDKFSVVQKMIKCAHDQKRFYLNNNGVAQRDFIHVYDVAQILVELMETPLKNEIINVGTGEPVSVKNILDLVIKKHGTIDIKHTESENETPFSSADVRKIFSLVKHRPRRILDFLDSLN